MALSQPGASDIVSDEGDLSSGGLMNVSTSIIIVAVILSLSILAATRFTTMGVGGSYFVIHDRWTGAMTRCYETARPPGLPETRKAKWYCETREVVGQGPVIWK